MIPRPNLHLTPARLEAKSLLSRSTYSLAMDLANARIKCGPTNRKEKYATSNKYDINKTVQKDSTYIAPPSS